MLVIKTGGRRLIDLFSAVWADSDISSRAREDVKHGSRCD